MNAEIFRFDVDGMVTAKYKKQIAATSKQTDTVRVSSLRTPANVKAEPDTTTNILTAPERFSRSCRSNCLFVCFVFDTSHTSANLGI